MTTPIKIANKKYSLYSEQSKYITGLRNKKCNFNWDKLVKQVEKASMQTSDISNNPIFKIEHNKNPPDIYNACRITEEKLPTVIDDINFWHLIRRINCYDKSDGRMTKNNIVLSHNECLDVITIIDLKYIPKLKECLVDVPIMDGIDISDYNNLLTHIIAKGEDFYNGIIANPMVSLYLCDQFYPVYTWLKQLA
jgi:hypothetical protein